MAALLGIIAVVAVFLAVAATAVGLGHGGSDIQLILGGMYAVVATVATAGAFIVTKLEKITGSSVQ